MILILAPAKNMADPEQAAVLPSPPLSRPAFSREAALLAGELGKLAPWQLETVLAVNPQLALRAFEAYQRFGLREERKTAALLAYQGLQYQHINAGDFTLEDFAVAQERVRIISGLYGVLRPLDGILPYRLEMQCRYPFQGKRLYRFWGRKLWDSLDGADPGGKIVNLASLEYAKAILPYAPPGQVITCDFLVPKRGKLTCVATAAKMARGEMVRMAVKKRMTQPEELQAFQWNYFRFQPKLSKEVRYVFAPLEN